MENKKELRCLLSKRHEENERCKENGTRRKYVKQKKKKRGKRKMRIRKAIIMRRRKRKELRFSVSKMHEGKTIEDIKKT